MAKLVVLRRRTRVLASCAGLLLWGACQEQEPAPGPRATGRSAALVVARAVEVSGDTYLRSGSPNQNQGSEPILRLQSSGKNRGLLFFDAVAIRNAVSGGTLATATLELTIDSAATNWGDTGRPITLHRLLQTSSEYTATWNCASDASIYNSQADCTGALRR